MKEGELVGSYRIVRLIGQGGTGEVSEAIHEPLSRRVAMKTIRGDIVGGELVARFRREAEASAALGHPNIVQVTDFILEPSRPPMMVMELFEGRTLRELVSSAQRLEPCRGVFIALQVLSGLAAAQRAGIVHRDVKPTNVFLQKTLAVRDHVKLLDFGVAKLLEAATTAGDPLAARREVLGTRAYMAPEQALGGSVNARTDLYAVGATLYYALSGWRPKTTEERRRLPLLEVASQVDPGLAAVVEKSLEDDPARRFGSAEEMAEALSTYSKNRPGLGLLTLGRGMPARPSHSSGTGRPCRRRSVMRALTKTSSSRARSRSPRRRR